MAALQWPCMGDPALAAKLAYALLFGGWSLFTPYMSVILRDKGMSPGEIGTATSARPLGVLVAAPLWTCLMDARGWLRPLMVAACSSAGAATVALYGAPAGGLTATAVAMLCFCNAPVGPVIDRCTLRLCSATGTDWGKQRLWGAVTWGLLCPVAGLAYDAGGLAAWIMPLAQAVALLGVAAVVCRGLPDTTAPARLSAMRRLAATACRPRFAWFLFAVASCATGLQLVSVFVFLRLKELGATRLLMGLSVSVSVSIEIPIFRVTGRALRTLGARGLLCVALLCQSTRFVGYSLLSNPWWVLTLEPLHGITFACFWSAAVNEVHAVAPEGTETAAQGLLSGIAFGLGPFIGTLVGGWIYNELGPAVMFRCYAALLAVVLCLSLLDIAFHGSGRHAGHQQLHEEEMGSPESGAELGSLGAAPPPDSVHPESPSSESASPG
eukprot:TRINITY_DN32370_c0_g1_i1.p1 TRINITY_DN32370_c0_g1~~TRINITY_DN32370_c0_g1_i1.p1  ORF type:complete len:468 (+),score=99.95 TRINITY_DN32370_c0_g1_i1:88-1404(+)